MTDVRLITDEEFKLDFDTLTQSMRCVYETLQPTPEYKLACSLYVTESQHKTDIMQMEANSQHVVAIDKNGTIAHIYGSNTGFVNREIIDNRIIGEPERLLGGIEKHRIPAEESFDVMRERWDQQRKLQSSCTDRLVSFLIKSQVEDVGEVEEQDN